uniref:Uncharacterized protein n=1 Tax=Phlebotomus papatasi TaxID=29031 RepID=A0A1B0DIL1_PHLPP
MSNLETALSMLMTHQMRAEERNQALFQQLGATMSSLSMDAPRREMHSNKLPTLEVPDFSGDRTQWPNFKGMFLSIVHNNRRLSDIQRLQYLKSLVSGNALKLIRNVPMSEQGYDSAWRLLMKHFDDAFTVVHHEIEKFCRIPAISTLNVESFTDLYATAVSVLDSLDGQNATSRDPWVIYLLLSKLDSETKAFLDFLSTRLKSLEMCQTIPATASNQQVKTTPSKPIRSRLNLAAVTRDSSSTSFPACQQTYHKVFRCPTFLEMSPPDRLALVRQHNLCRKCITSTHNSRDCTFFPCRRCSGPHNTLLHGSFESPAQSVSNPKPSVTSAPTNPTSAAPLTAEPFQLNRITQIQNLTDISHWHYVPSHLNPADIVSRGMYPRDLQGSHSWWDGPAFIVQGIFMWPTQCNGSSMIITTNTSHPELPLLLTFQQSLFSITNDFERLLRIVAYVLRFFQKSSSRNRDVPITSELLRAEKVLVRLAQGEQLEEVRQAIRSGAVYRSQKFHHLRQLCPFIDEENIIRVGGRLEESIAVRTAVPNGSSWETTKAGFITLICSGDSILS